MSSFPANVLDVIFTLQPVDGTTHSQVAVVTQARADFDKVLDAVFHDLAMWESQSLPIDYATLRARVNDAARSYAGVVNELGTFQAPAVDAIKLSFLWADKAIGAPLGPIRGRLVACAKTESEKSELLAHSAIVLDAPLTAAWHRVSTSPK